MVELDALRLELVDPSRIELWQAAVDWLWRHLHHSSTALINTIAELERFLVSLIEHGVEHLHLYVSDPVGQCFEVYCQLVVHALNLIS